MAKKPQRTTKPTTKQKSDTIERGIFTKYPNAVFIGIIGVLLIVFFHQAFFNQKVFSGADNVVSLVYEPYIQHAKELGINTFWNPFIFSGMPTWGSHVPGGEFEPALPPMLILKVYGGVQSVVNILPLPDSFWNIFNYFLLGVFTYFFCLNRKFDRYPAFITALAIVFSLYTINWIMAGHNTKITVFSLIPAALLLIDKLFEERKILYVILLIIVFHLQFNAAHLQIIFYSILTTGLYILYKLYEGESFGKFGIVVGITIIAAAFAFIMLSHNYLGMWEYKSFSIREAGSGGSDTGAKGGLDYNYATNWSFSLIEVITFFIPSFVGFGAPTYWGGMPFTESPIYMGIVISTLALLGVVLKRKDKFVHFWIFLGVFVLLLSFGKELPVLYNLFFNYVSFFNNFRIPSMILCILIICLGMLGGIGVNEVFRRSAIKPLKSGKALDPFFLRGIIVVGVLLVVAITGKSVYESMYISVMKSSGSPSIQVFEQVDQAMKAGQSAQIPVEYKNATFEGVFGLVYRDTIVAIFFTLGVFGLLYGLVKKKIGLGVVQFGLCILLIADLWIVDYKPIKMITKKEQQQSLQETDFIRFLKQDRSPYRILPIQIHDNDNWFVAFGIQSIAGYHPAKLKLYDDVRNTMYNEFHFQDAKQFAQVNRMFLNMLNTKYILTPFPLENSGLKPAFRGEQALVYENTSVLPRAFFVAKHVTIQNDKSMFDQINAPDYDPAATAYLSATLEKEILTPADAIAQTKVHYTNYEINGFTIEVETPAEAILKLSEVYYPSGWKASIDGSDTKIYRTDYCLRAIVVPAGKHTITFDFEPRTYRTGLMLTTVTNYLIGVILLYYIVMYLRKMFMKKKSDSTSS